MFGLMGLLIAADVHHFSETEIRRQIIVDDQCDQNCVVRVALLNDKQDAMRQRQTICR